MTWVLIFAFLSWKSGGGVISQEFNGKDACEFARTEIIKMAPPNSWDKTMVTCVPKGTP